METRVASPVVVSLIQRSRQAFLSGSATRLDLAGNVKLYTSESNVKIFGIESDHQSSVNFDQLRHSLAFQMLGARSSYPQFVQIFGDSQLFSPAGTKFAGKMLNNFLNKEYPNSIVLFGFTGKHNPVMGTTDTNHLLSLMVDRKEINPARVLGNMVDFHTPLAIKEWPGVSISNNIRNYTLVYTNTEHPGAKFGIDTTTTDGLTNTAAICCDGGVQSILQLINLVEKNIPVIGVKGLRDLSDRSNPLIYDIKTGKPYLSAVDFFEYLKNKTMNQYVDSKKLDVIIAKYFATYSLTSPTAKDADTKRALWEKALEKMHSDNFLEKLNNLIVYSALETNKQDISQQPHARFNACL